jgi:hypothetical protein
VTKSLRSIDVSKKYRVTLTFLLDEEVTPVLFAQKIALACAGGALRPGEGLLMPTSEATCIIVDETLSAPYKWVRHVEEDEAEEALMTRITFEGRCVGCKAPMTYEADALSSGAPFFEPVESRTATYAHGHLCPPCTGAVMKLLEQRRKRRVQAQ